VAQEFVSVFEAAGWDHHGEDGVSTQDWPRDPLGSRLSLNEKDARSDQIPPALAGLINVVRQLGLVYDNTVYMDNDVPEGQALLKGRQEIAEMNCGGGSHRRNVDPTIPGCRIR
jgi:hypothetical protein